MNTDIIFCILNCLETYDILKCGSVNKQFNKISKNELIWKRLFEAKFGMYQKTSKRKIIPKNYRMDYKRHIMGIRALERAMSDYKSLKIPF
jgi:hypothetical protein